MAYGDAAASLIGERYGKKKFHIFARKSVEGSVAMLIVSILSITVGLLYFSFFYSFTLSGFLLAGVAAALVATVAEALTPLGFDNIMVPLLSALSFFFLIGLVELEIHRNRRLGCVWKEHAIYPPLQFPLFTG